MSSPSGERDIYFISLPVDHPVAENGCVRMCEDVSEVSEDI